MPISLLLLTFSLFFSFSVLTAQEKTNLTKQDTAAVSNPIQKIDEFRYKIGNVILDSKRREIMLQGAVNMEKGVVELLACAQGGKLHETVLVIDAVPYHLQVALLLLGLQYKGGLEYQGDARTPQGDSVEVYVTWSKNGKDTTVRGEDLVWDVKAASSMEHTSWIFVGSKMVEGRFMADQEKSLITTYHDPFTIFDNPLQGGANDELYKVNEQLVPPKGTPVTVSIKALK
ncbi:MAG: hypothetical protein EPO24_10970, partial [Bacteroidetes bacterium]